MATSPERVGSPLTHYTSLLEEIVGCGDMVLLDTVSIETVVDNLRQRYSSDGIYTYIGKVVVSVNPYKKMTIYTAENIFEYRSRNMFELPPHIFAIADDSYRSMKDRRSNQCIIISGESGAGKTEASKLVMQYVAGVTSNTAEVERVKEQLLLSNPVLEAFGNAKTVRNDNSSRFGKYMDIEFNYEGDPLGGVITNYLLEKTRVVYQAVGERNFHIFYQLLNGASTDVLEMLNLKSDFAQYNYVNQSGCNQALTINDGKDFTQTLKAMDILGFTPNEVSGVLELLSGILNLGNFRFSGYSLPNGTDACTLTETDPNVCYSCDMFGVSVASFKQALTHRRVETAKDCVTKPLSESEAIHARDALAKAIYSRLFSWLIERLNKSIEARATSKKVSMGVLDIYGFEIFRDNSFEQFIINYCNEKLQQVFIELVLHQEQEEYIREGIEWVQISYFDNGIICQLIEHPSEGVLSLLDEECLRPGNATDLTYLDKISHKHKEHGHFHCRQTRSLRSDHTIPENSFRLVHYAGRVLYKVDGFLDKNKDLLYKDLSFLMHSSERQLLKALFPEGNPVYSSDNPTVKRSYTAASQFKSSVSELVSNLMEKSPNYIRCIKPNATQKPHSFDSDLVEHQVRYLGLMENIQVRRAGFAFKQFYEEFLVRYKMLSKDTWPVWKASARGGTRKILQACRKVEECEFGRTKIFIRDPKTVFLLEDKRKRLLHIIATIIQKIFRGYIQRKKYLQIRNAQVCIARHWKGYQVRKDYLQVWEAAIVLQKHWRGKMARTELWRMKCAVKGPWAVGVIIRYWRGYKVRKHYGAILKRKTLNYQKAAAEMIIRLFKAYLNYRFLVFIRDHLPTPSPIDKRWPRVPAKFKDTSKILRIIHHRWRCQQLWDHYSTNPRRKARMMEKARASSLFAGKKKLYKKTVSVPFYGDHLSLRNDARWSKVAAEFNEPRIVWADNIIKVNRNDAKTVPQLMVVTAKCFYIMDPKTFVVKSRVGLGDLECVSLSSHSDGNCILHVNQPKANVVNKGDLVLNTPNVVELVTKLHATIQETFRKALKVNICEQVEVNFIKEKVTIRFRVSADAGTGPDCRRKGPVIDFLVL